MVPFDHFHTAFSEQQYTLISKHMLSSLILPGTVKMLCMITYVKPKYRLDLPVESYLTGLIFITNIGINVILTRLFESITVNAHFTLCMDKIQVTVTQSLLAWK